MLFVLWEGKLWGSGTVDVDGRFHEGGCACTACLVDVAGHTFVADIPLPKTFEDFIGAVIVAA